MAERCRDRGQEDAMSGMNSLADHLASGSLETEY